MMTQCQYVKVNNGLHCPECGSPHLDGGPVEIEAGEAWQVISCLDCCGTWRDVYTLTRFEGFREGSATTRKTITAPRIKIRLT